MPFLRAGDKVAIVCCSNGQDRGNEDKIQQLSQMIAGMELVPVLSEYLYTKEFSASAGAPVRADTLMDYYRDDSIKAIFDISGGDIANEILPYLDFEEIAKTRKIFWGYSDLTTILNAIYTKTKKTSVLYQIRNLLYENGRVQREDFCDSVLGQGEKLFDFSYEWIQGERMEGIVVGGNIRCFLKLAGTPYLPDMKGKILLLEAFHGRMAQMTTYLAQMAQMGIFEQVEGVLLGTFTQLQEQKKEREELFRRIQTYAKGRPVAYTTQIGHGADSKAIRIGEKRIFQ